MSWHPRLEVDPLFVVSTESHDVPRSLPLPILSLDPLHDHPTTQSPRWIPPDSPTPSQPPSSPFSLRSSLLSTVLPIPLSHPDAALLAHVLPLLCPTLPGPCPALTTNRLLVCQSHSLDSLPIRTYGPVARIVLRASSAVEAREHAADETILADESLRRNRRHAPARPHRADGASKTHGTRPARGGA